MPCTGPLKSLESKQMPAELLSKKLKLRSRVFRKKVKGYLKLYQPRADGKPTLYNFRPRPDKPIVYDQQTGFLESTSKVSFCRGGNGSGKTETAAHKAARFLLWKQPPPREDTPFMVVSDTYEQVANICWKEKLKRLIPPELIDEPKCAWQNKARDLPYVIALKDSPAHPGRNWQIEFRSLDQGRRHFQGRSFGGFWFSEQFEWEIFDEVYRGCRDTWYDGGHFAEFTPIDPDLTVGYEERMESNPPGWAEFRLNVDCNEFVDEDWRESFLTSQSDELRETRRKGDLMELAGAIYRNWNPAVHACSDERWLELTQTKCLPPRNNDPKKPPDLQQFLAAVPKGVFFRRGLDWGESQEHAFVCLWGWKDGAGRWFIFDEFVDNSGLLLYSQRQKEIKSRYPWPVHSPYFGNTYADPSRPLLIMDFSANGLPTLGASNNVEEGIEYVRRHVMVNKITQEPKLFVLRSRCPILCRQMRKYRWLRSFKAGTTTDRRLNPKAAKMEPLKWEDDTCDALRYMMYSDRARGDMVPVSFTPENDPSRYGLHIKGRYDQYKRQRSDLE